MHSNEVAPASFKSSVPSQALLSNSSSLPVLEPPGTAAKRLFHHFQLFTCQTLFATPDVWSQALRLCFRFEFLMSMVLCIAARHLTALRPEDETYSMAAAYHLHRAIQQFHDELSKNLESINADAFVATTILLQYEVWTRTDFLTPQDDGKVSFNPDHDRFFTQSASMKQMFLQFASLMPRRPSQVSIFLPHIQRNSLSELAQAANISNSTGIEYQNFFSYHRPLSLELLEMPLPNTLDTDLATWQHHGHTGQGEPDPIEHGYALVVEQICILQSYLPEANPLVSIENEPSLALDLARSIFTFPILCRGPFASMVHQSDPHALLLLYHFYRTTRILLSSNHYWWAHRRSAAAEASLKEWLVDKSAGGAAASY